MSVRKAWLKYIINFEVCFVVYLYIMVLIRFETLEKIIRFRQLFDKR